MQHGDPILHLLCYVILHVLFCVKCCVTCYVVCYMLCTACALDAMRYTLHVMHDM